MSCQEITIRLEGKRELNLSTDERAELRWAVLGSVDSERTDQEILKELGWEPRYGGTGNPYAYTPTIRRVKERVLITQRRGRDF